MTVGPMRIAVLTFVYEGDRELAFDTFDSIVRSSPSVKFDFFFTDDASPSRVGDALVAWCHDRGFVARCVRYESRTGYRGAIERTLSLLREVAQSSEQYDLILRIDTDALVVRKGIAAALQEHCVDPTGLYGVGRRMRVRDAVAMLLDLLPVGLKRKRSDGVVERSYTLTRLRPVWWWRLGVRALFNGFRFKFPDGCCYVLGGELPSVLHRAGSLDLYRENRYGLITSEEDVIVAMMCRASGVKVHDLAAQDPTWSHMNWMRERVLDAPADSIPYVIHPLKATPDGLALRAQIRGRLPLFVDS